MPIYHVLGVVDLVFIYLIYKDKGILKIWGAATVIFTIIYFVNSIFFVSIWEYNSFALSAVSLVVLFIGLNFLLRKNIILPARTHIQNGFSFINSGFVIYAGGVFFVNLFSMKILVGEVEGFLHNAWMIEGFGALIRSFLILIGLLICFRNEQ